MHNQFVELIQRGMPYDELHSLLDVVININETPSPAHLYRSMGKILQTILPCSMGGIGVFERESKSSAVAISMGTSFGAQSINGCTDHHSAFFAEMITNCLKSRELLFVEHLHQSDLNTDTPLKNFILDAVIKDEDDLGCFYWFANVQPLLVCKYHIVSTLLLVAVYDKLVQSLRNKVVSDCEAVNLTDREREIISSIRSGLCNKTIARQLNISVNTVKSHIYNIFQKLQASNRVEALFKAEQAGYLVNAQPY